jgi:hypothetical protein
MSPWKRTVGMALLASTLAVGCSKSPPTEPAGKAYTPMVNPGNPKKKMPPLDPMPPPPPR